MAAKTQQNPIQEKIDIADIKDGVVIMKNGNLRAVLMCSSVNFFLKSQDEQDALTYAYQDFLNSLDFSLQVVIATRKFSLDEYLTSLDEKLKNQTNELLKIQTSEYINFIKSLSETANVMTSSFFAVIPFAPVEKKEGGLLDKIIQPFKRGAEIASQDFEQMKTQLWHRVEQVTASLNSIGIKSVPLNSDELFELYYGMYNPEAKEKPKLSTIRSEKLL